VATTTAEDAETATAGGEEFDGEGAEGSEETIEQVAENGEGAAASADAQLSIPGMRSRLDDSAGMMPQSATASLGSARLTLTEGQIDLDDDQWYLVRATCTAVTIENSRKQGVVTGTERKHKLKPDQIRVCPKDVLDYIENRGR
jgi:hypothetical protein